MSNIQRQDVRQALVYIDAFTNNFSPLTIYEHMALLPLVNIPCIDYTIEILISSGIEEIYLISSIYSEKLKLYLNNNKWLSKLKKLTITLYTSESCQTLGDAFREIYNKGNILKSDFVLINGLLASNLNIKPILELHKKRRVKDKIDSLMTLLYRKTSGKIPYDPPNRCLVIYDAISYQLLHHSTGTVLRNKNDCNIAIPLEILEKCNNVKVSYDLFNMNICICSPQVPQFFADNFDYQSLAHFINDILINEEILGSQLHVYIEDKFYVFTLSDLAMYYRISFDILNEWLYPISPETWRHPTIPPNDTRIYNQHDNKNIFLPLDISTFHISQNAELEQNVLISNNCEIGESSLVFRSVIGSNCSIGKNCVIKNSILWDGVKIYDDCIIDTCLIGNNVTLHKKVHLNKHCLIGPNVFLPASLKLPVGTVCLDDAQKASTFLSHFKTKKFRVGIAKGSDNVKYVTLRGSPNGHKDTYLYRIVPGDILKQDLIPYDIIKEETLSSTENGIKLTDKIIPCYVLKNKFYKWFGPRNLVLPPFFSRDNRLFPSHARANSPRRKLMADAFENDSQNSSEDETGSRASSIHSSISSLTSSNQNISSLSHTSSRPTSPIKSHFADMDITTILNSDSKNNSSSNKNLVNDAENKRNRTISADEHYIMSTEDTRGFYFETAESFQRCEEENIPLKNVVLEINASKHAYNVTLHDLWVCVSKIIFKDAALNFIKEGSKGDDDALIRYYQNRLVRYKDLLANYFKTPESQYVLLDRILLHSSNTDPLSIGPNSTKSDNHQQKDFSTFAVKLTHYAYEIDIIPEEVIVDWFTAKRAQITSPKIFKQMETFVKWLEEAEEEEEEQEILK
ncbi:unnamed protein product [Gordionus sp. m RMFG-2023]|uniref:uncharacterized protein LOC135930275 n=1 Tax=Gordionus sp. m RMFG-2023 TaxID=3053472 RepID=UPI0030E2074E